MDTLRLLFSFSGNECAFPDCEQRLVSPDGEFIAQVCHIEAAEPGGERFNAEMDNEQRRAAANLMLMCYEHHVVTNNVVTFPVERLRNMKETHEAPFRDGLKDLFDRVVDWTESTPVTPARTLRAYLAYHGWDDADHAKDPDVRIGSLALINGLAEAVRRLSRPAREMLVLLLQRGREVHDQPGCGANYGLLLQEILDVTGLTGPEMITRVGQLETRNFTRIMDEDGDWDFYDFTGPFAMTRLFSDLHWDELVSYCTTAQVPLREIIVNLRFDLLDGPRRVDAAKDEG